MTLGFVGVSGCGLSTVAKMLVESTAQRARLADAGFEPAPASTPRELERSVRTDYERNAAIVKTFAIKLE